MIGNLQTKLILLSILFILPLLPAFAENIRGQIIDSLSVDSEAINFGIYELVKISDRKSSEFQTGIELRIDIPPGLRNYRNSFALLLYKNIKPFPDTSMVNYSAKRYFMRLLPSRESTYIRIPFTADYDADIEPFTDVVPVHINNDDLPLILVVSPVAKGIPDNAFKQKLQISVKEIFGDRGGVKFNFPNISPYGEKEEIQVFLNEMPVDRDSRHILKSGIYRLRATSSHAHPIERSVEIIRGEEMVIDLPFDYGSPLITVIVPAGFRAFINGAEIQAEDGLYTGKVKPGKNRILYQSDSLKYEKEFTVTRANKLRINLNIDINFSDSRQANSDSYCGD